MNFRLKHILLTISTLFCLASPVSAEECSTTTASAQRPKVAVVLAGGGAKGLAHVGALKVIEQAGIPIDIVVGTSMGSIVGGLYSIGYTVEELENVIHGTDWMQLLFDNPDYGNELLSARKANGNYQLRVSLDRNRLLSSTGKGGLLEGRNISQLFRNLTIGLPDSISFDEFPIRFACVSTNAVNGSRHEFHKGNLPVAMRSSMAIPGVFTPVKADSGIFIDGWIVDNFPVDVARNMGADIIIGVDLVQDNNPETQANNMLDIMTYVIDLVSEQQYLKNVKNSDIYIDVDVTGYSAASFTPIAIDSLLCRGERRANEKFDELKALHDRLQRDYNIDSVMQHRERRMRNVNYNPKCVNYEETLSQIFHPHPHMHFAKFRNNYLRGQMNLGARFDNDEYASIQFASEIKLTKKRESSLGIYARLGERMYGGIALSSQFWKNMKAQLSYRFEHKGLTYRYHGSKIGDLEDNHNLLRFGFSQEWRHVMYTWGIRYDMHHYHDKLIDTEIMNIDDNLRKEKYLNYFLHTEYNTLDALYFPTEGSRFMGRLEVLTDNLYKYNDRRPVPILFLSYEKHWNTFGKFSISPHIQTRVIFEGNAEVPFALNNVIGGPFKGMKVSHQLTMAGIAYMESVRENGIVLGGLNLQQQLGDNHFIESSIDAATFCDDFIDAFESMSHTWGIKLGYSYRSLAGPVSLCGYWSERTKQIRLLLNVGYYF